jgi:uncharacterized protein
MPQLAPRLTRLAAILAIATAATAAAARAQQSGSGNTLPPSVIPALPGTDTAITDPARLRAAAELLAAVGGEAQFAATQGAMIDAMTQSGPMSLMRDIFEDWAHTYLTWDALRPDIIQLYARTFTTEDMVQAASFFRTPAGQHFTAKSGFLMTEGGKIGQRVAQLHSSELEAAIQKRVKELQAQRAKPAPQKN